MRERTKAWRQGDELVGNRKVADLRAQIRVAASRLFDAGARRRAERRVRLLAALLDGGRSPGIQV
jgi:hypothetical protein